MARKTKQPKATKGARGTDQNVWWEQQVEAPRSDLPDPDKQARRARRYRIWVIASVFLAPFALFASFANYAMSETPEAALSASEEYAETRPYAILAARQWLAAEPAPLPGGFLVGWDRAIADEYTQQDTESRLDFRNETHYLTVATASGTAYTATVQLATSDGLGTRVLSTPSLVPQVPVDDSFEVDSYPDSEEAVVSDEMRVAVQAWAESFVGGDPERLRAVVADPNPAHAYIPLVGAALSEVEAGTGWVSPLDETDPEEAPDLVFVEVDLGIVWPPADSAYFEEEDAPPPADLVPATLTYTVLIAGAGTAAPRVVAWGGGGEGLDLTQYGNAVEGRSVSIDSDPLGNSDGLDAEAPGLDVDGEVAEPDNNEGTTP